MASVTDSEGITSGVDAILSVEDANGVEASDGEAEGEPACREKSGAKTVPTTTSKTTPMITRQPIRP